MRKHLENILDWIQNIVFWYMDELQMDLVRSLCQEKGNLDFEEPCWVFSMWPNKSLSVIEKRDDLLVRPVGPKHSRLVDSFWKFKDEGTEDMIRKLCEEGKVFGAFHGEDDAPAAWMFEYNSGALGNLYTREEFRGRGFASEVVLAITKDAASRGLEPYVHIADWNTPSMALFTKLGLTKQTKACWMGFSNKSLEI